MSYQARKFFTLLLFFLLVLFIWIVGLMGCVYAEIDIEIIKEIESNGNPLAYNFKSQARGVYQITPICLEDYNIYHDKKYIESELFNPIINKKI